MAEAVSHSTSQMSDDDLAAMAEYLKDNAAPAATATSAAVAANVMQAAAAIYKDNCAACHRDNGIGDRGLFPRLAGSPLVQADDPTTLIGVVLQGSRAVSTAAAPTGPAMPAFDWRLGDGEVAAVLSWIRNSWGQQGRSGRSLCREVGAELAGGLTVIASVAAASDDAAGRLPKLVGGHRTTLTQSQHAGRRA
jgi:mono/diheme cytochrome c family protein